MCCHSMVQGGTDDSWDGVATCVLLQCGAGWDDSPAGMGFPIVPLPCLESSAAVRLRSR